MAWVMKKIRFLSLLILCAATVFYGCEGSEPREQIDDTVKELTGEKNLGVMNKVIKDINAIQNKQDERLKQFDESTDK